MDFSIYRTKIFGVIVFLFCVAIQLSFTQSLPSYGERASLVLKDSSFAFLQSLTSEGGIDTAEYRIGTGDKFLISITGIEEIVYRLEVDKEGALYIPRIGGVQLSNESLTSAKRIIFTSLKKVYKNVDIFVSLIDIRRIKITIGGDIKKPTEVNLFANSRLSDLLTKNILLNPSSDLRNIQIRRVDGSIRKYDYLSFIRLADNQNNPSLNDRDFIFIDKVDKTVSIVGAVKFPGIYEHCDTDNADFLIKLAGGFLSKARLDSIEIVRFEDDFTSQRSIFGSSESFSQSPFKLFNGDKIIVREIPRYLLDNFVFIDGWVKYPGPYRIIDNITSLKEVIETAGGFLSNASLVDATVKRMSGSSENDSEFERLRLIPRSDMTDDEYDYFKSKSRQRVGKVVVDFVSLFNQNGTTENITLRRNDIITIPEKKDFVIILGQVVNPGNVVYNPDLTVDDYIALAGGYAWRALKNDVRVIKGNTGEWIDKDDVDIILPGDAIWVPEDPPAPRFWTVFKDVLAIVGNVATVVAATVAVVVSTR